MSEKTVIPVMHCFDNNYAMPAGVAFLSLLECADKSCDYRLYVLHTDITAENQRRLHEIVKRFPGASLEFVNMENRFEDLFSRTGTKGHFSKEMYYKFLAPTVFPQYDKIIIADVDVVYRDDVSREFLSFDVDEPYYLAGQRGMVLRGTWLEEFYGHYEEKFTPEEREKLVTCAGYWIFNLKRMREHSVEKAFIDFAFRHAGRLIQPEQDVVNIVCFPDIRQLPVNTVVCSYAYDLLRTDADGKRDLFYSAEELRFALEHPVQLHYAAAGKPWNDPSMTGAELWFQYLARTPFLREYLEGRERKRLFDNPEFFRKRRRLMSVSLFRRFWFLHGTDILARRQVRTDPLISVVCCTYNHEAFIEKALESIVGQETEFSFEVIVADDASTDGTQNIVERYAQAYPHIIRTILRSRNVGVGQNYFDALCSVRGTYVALCDGDDCWLDIHKLQKQTQFLERHPDYTICCSDVLRHYPGGEKEDSVFSVRSYLPGRMRRKKALSFEDLLTCRFIASSTCIMRWKMRNNVPQWLKRHCVIDFPLTLIHAMLGKIKVFDEVFAQYNIHARGVSRQDQTPAYRKKMDDILNYVNEYTEGYKEKEIKAFLKKNGTRTP